MRKSTVIATCLVNMGSRPNEAELAVRKVFDKEHPGHDYEAWNQEVDQQRAEAFIQSVDHPDELDVAQLIRELGVE